VCDSQKKCNKPKVGTILNLGAQCNVTSESERCDRGLGQVCTVSGDAGSVDGFCKQSTLAADGEPCGVINGDPVGCLDGDCRQVGQGERCFGFREFGADCDDVSGPFCNLSTRCRAGKCAGVYPGACK
jgi:hypothetical protein